MVRQLQIPLSIRAYTTLDANGDYNVYVNQDLSEPIKEKALLHEKAHIQQGDFYSDELACMLEMRVR